MRAGQEHAMGPAYNPGDRLSVLLCWENSVRACVRACMRACLHVPLYKFACIRTHRCRYASVRASPRTGKWFSASMVCDAGPDILHLPYALMRQSSRHPLPSTRSLTRETARVMQKAGHASVFCSYAPQQASRSRSFRSPRRCGQQPLCSLCRYAQEQQRECLRSRLLANAST